MTRIVNVLLSEPVEWQDEYRCFLLDRKVRTVSPYARSGRLTELNEFAASEGELSSAASFAERVAGDPEVQRPRAIALDVGLVRGVGWAVVEANGAWGSGIYGCNPDEVLEVIRHAISKA